MSQNQEERDINGLRVITRMLPPMRAYRLLGRLGKLAAPIAGAMTDKALAVMQSGTQDQKMSAMTPAMLAVFQSLEGDELEALALDVLRGTAVMDTAANRRLDLVNAPAIDNAFAGNLRAMLGAMMFALEVNYRDFFAGLGQAEAPEPAQTEPAPTTTSP
jgi:hypothetical protein